MLDVHPDELLHRDDLNADERARLDAHLRECRACVLEIQLAKDIGSEKLAARNDEDRIARSIDRALEAQPARRRKVLPYVLVAAAGMRWIWMPGRAAWKSASSAALVTTPTRSPRLAAIGPAKLAVPPTTKPPGTTSLVTCPTMTKVGASGTGSIDGAR